ncbi:hypothetical protein [Paenibacillus xylanexedens]|uniref:hypothetical protein n=1 Tax=Paenibacillus xylanexedens TaxID=528191 RepID=UPI001C8CF854|nr:hypothetical protein [Paenibacillus xylanexedens]
MLKLVIYSIYSSGSEVRLSIAGAVPLNHENAKLLGGSLLFVEKGLTFLISYGKLIFVPFLGVVHRKKHENKAIEKN